MISTPVNKKLPPKRQTSAPFVRKPIPLSPICQTEGKPSARPPSYNAIPPLNLNGASSLDDQGVEGIRSLERHLTLTDLLAVGIGGTIGSGLFVLAGLVSHEYAGPSAVLSWAMAGLSALLSGCCYAELSSRIPLAGSAYAYCFVALGEWPAFLAATCLSLEYIVASAAVARSWGDKCSLWLLQQFADTNKTATTIDDDANHWIRVWFNVDGVISPLACFISSATVLLLLAGIKESKQVTNLFTSLKVGLVLFMIVAGSFYIQPNNWTPFFPKPFGISGMLRGATGTFFGYLGYDQVCGLAGEAVHPKRNLPVAILLTLLSVMLIYMTATLVLTGMQSWPDISPVSGFPTAFYAQGANWAGQLTALGEILTLPIVVLVTVMVQPRLQYAMAEDGLLPAFFRKLDANGNLWNGTLVAGTLFIVVSTVVPFTHLNDVISCAVLTALSLTDSSLILLWHEAPDPESDLAHILVLSFHGVAVASSVLWTKYAGSRMGRFAATVATFVVVLIPFVISKCCPRTKVFGGRRHHYHGEQLRRDDGYFRTPLVPFLPCAGIYVNWYLIAQLDLLGVTGLLVFLGISSLYYFVYASHHSVGNTTGWAAGDVVPSAPAENVDMVVDETLGLTQNSF